MALVARKTWVAALGTVSLLLCGLAPLECTAFVLQAPLRPPTAHPSGAAAVRASTIHARAAARRFFLPSSSLKERGRALSPPRMTAEQEEAIVEVEPIPEGEEIDAQGGAEGGAEEELGKDQEVVAEIGAGIGADGDRGEEGEGELGVDKEKEEEEEEVDPMAEVKQQIKDLEKELTKEEGKLADVRGSSNEKGEMGFLMMAAKVQNFRKSSGSGSGEYEDDAKAAVLTAMLPAFTPFEEAEEKLALETEKELKFNSNYQALYRQLKDVFTKTGASDFFAVVGESFEWRRHDKVSEEYSDVMAEGKVLECLSPGLELKKNVITKATCKVSLGPEKVEEEEEETPEEAAVEEEPTLRDAGDAEGEAEVDGGEEGDAEAPEAEEGDA